MTQVQEVINAARKGQIEQSEYLLNRLITAERAPLIALLREVRASLPDWADMDMEGQSLLTRIDAAIGKG